MAQLPVRSSAIVQRGAGAPEVPDLRLDPNLGKVAGTCLGDTLFTQAADAGRTLLAVRSPFHSADVRDVMLQSGRYDAQSRGAELTRTDAAGVPAHVAGQRPDRLP